MNFDYEALDLETRVTVKQRTSELHTLHNDTMRNVIEMGKRFCEVRGLLRYTRPGFQAWCGAEGWSVSSAYRCIHSFEKYGMYTNLVQISDSVLYLLAAPETPEQARTIILDAAESGEVGIAVAQGIITAQKLAMAATNKADPPTIDVNAAQDVADEISTSGYVTLADGVQAEPTEETIIPAVHAAQSERHARQGQHMIDSKAGRVTLPTDNIPEAARRILDSFQPQQITELLTILSSAVAERV